VFHCDALFNDGRPLAGKKSAVNKKIDADKMKLSFSHPFPDAVYLKNIRNGMNRFIQFRRPP
jgi:hypothetical protein